jgi:CxxC-x17-CxxC domain-containing protein
MENEERKMYKATCSECNQACEVPFEPSEDRPVKCKECYMKSRPPRRSFDNNRRSSSFGGGRGNGRFGGNRPQQDREMFDATCTECGQKCKVPFKPTEGKKVLCKDCFMKSRQEF